MIHNNEFTTRGAFNLPLSADDLGSYAHVMEEDRSEVGIIIPRPFAMDFVLAHAGLSRVDLGDDTYLTTAEDPELFVQDTKSARSFLLDNRPIFGLNHPLFSDDGHTISTEALADTISGVDPKNILIVTGAGMSDMADGIGVMSYDTYADTVGFSRQSHFPSHRLNRRFVYDFLVNPAMSARGVEILDAYREQLKGAVQPTPAHIALTGLVRELDGLPLVATVNWDRLHEGADLDVAHIIDRDWLSADAAKKLEPSEFVADFKERAPHLELVICAALSSDHKGIISYIRRQTENDKLRVAAINKSAVAPLRYLQKGDMRVIGDVQKILPQLNDMLRDGARGDFL